jgi:hypothetical protein
VKPLKPKPKPKGTVGTKKPTARHAPPPPQKKASQAMNDTQQQKPSPHTTAAEHNPALVRQGDTPQSRAQSARGVVSDTKSSIVRQAEESQARAQKGAGTGEMAVLTRGREYNETPEQYLARPADDRPEPGLLPGEEATAGDDRPKVPAIPGKPKDDDKK